MQYVTLFFAIQALVILAAGWRATEGCLVLDLFVGVVTAVALVRRRGFAGALRWLAVRLEAAAVAWERAQAGYREWTRPGASGPTGIERARQEGL